MNLCLVCQKEIPHLSRAGNQPKFCCQEHRRLWYNKEVATWKREHPESRWMPKVPKQECLVCHKSFSPVNKGQIFCSHSCGGKYANATRKKNLPICELCGNPVKKLRRRFCSRACKVEWYRGEEVYNYAGGKMRNYSSSFWLALTKQIRERDGVCQRCGKLPKPGVTLHVHHIYPWRFSRDDSPENLQALCASCHKKADAEFNLKGSI